MQNQKVDGIKINHTPAADIKGGDLVLFPAMVAVAAVDIKAGKTGVLVTEGVFELPKDATALAQGQAVFAKADGSVSATSGAGDLQAGVAWADAAGNDGGALVKINM